MKLKKFFAQILAVAMILSTMGMVAFADSNVASVTANGVTTEYATMQEAFDAAYASDATEIEIVLLPGTISEYAIVRQKLNQNVMIKGSEGAVYTGTIEIDGMGKMSQPETLTFDGITFDASNATAGQDFITNLKKPETNRYAHPHNVTIQNCSFTGNLAYDIVGARLITGENYDFYNCTGTDLHSMYQASGNSESSEVGVVDGCRVVNSKGGFSLGTNCRYNVTNTTIEALNDYALRWNTNDRGSNVTVTNCNLKAPMAIAVRGKTQDQAKATITNNVIVSTTGGAPLAKDVGKEADAVNIDIFAEGNFWGGSEPVISNIDYDVVTYFADEAKTQMQVAATSDIVAFIDTNANGIIDADEQTYTSVTEAIETASDQDIVNLLGKTVVIKDLPADPTNGRRWFDTDGKTLTIANGTFDLTGANVSDSVFRLEKAGTHLTFNNVDFVREATEPDTGFCYLVSLQGADRTVSFVNCDIELEDVDYNIVCNYSGAQSVFVENCTIETEDDYKLFQAGGVVLENSTVNAPNAALFYLNTNDSVITNSDVVAAVIATAAGTLLIRDNSNVEVANIYPYDAANKVEDIITVEAGSKLVGENIDLDLINDASAGEIMSKADSVELVFVENNEDAEALDNSVWDIVLVGSNAEVINRLNSADFTFVLDAEEDMTYEIAETNDEVEINNVNNDANRFEFHYKGKDNATTDTSDRIKLGTVSFTGYGEFAFSVDTTDIAENTNMVHATTLHDNIVDTFTVAAGNLVINNANEDTDGDEDFGTIGSTILVPTKNLTVNVAFPNSVVNNPIAYQDMKVVISGDDLAPVTVDLGSDAGQTDILGVNNRPDAMFTVSFVNGGYVVNFLDALTVNTSYDITVSGAGYRTARYTVRMTDNKTVNFWNNVKDADAAVEEGKAYAKLNYLAGDIVKDNKINTYDLSAVVSYFGETDLSATNNKTYAKYDLNRDGFIDSKDVAIVLVSWGN